MPLALAILARSVPRGKGVETKFIGLTLKSLGLASIPFVPLWAAFAPNCGWAGAWSHIPKTVGFVLEKGVDVP